MVVRRCRALCTASDLIDAERIALNIGGAIFCFPAHQPTFSIR